MSQTVAEWEHIIVDDGSIDATAKIVRANADPRTRYVFQENEGRSAARNAGMARARGQYLLFLDADDWLLPNALADQVGFLDSHPEYDVSVSDGAFCTDEGQVLASFSQRRGTVQAGCVLPRIVADSGLVGGTLTACVRSSLIRQHNVLFARGLTVGEDWLFWIEVAQHGAFGFLEADTCRYRWHASNTTNTISKQFRRDQLWIVSERVMQLPFFRDLTVEARRTFFYQVLVDRLHERPARQMEVTESDVFLALPSDVRAALLRLIAAEYLLAGTNDYLVRAWFETARALDSRNPKCAILGTLAAVDIRLARTALRAWRRAAAARPGRRSAASDELALSPSLQLE